MFLKKKKKKNIYDELIVSSFSVFRRVSDLKEVLWSGSLTFEHALSTSAANYDGKALVCLLRTYSYSTCYGF
jgi:hypothetical protein